MFFSPRMALMLMVPTDNLSDLNLCVKCPTLCKLSGKSQEENLSDTGTTYGKNTGDEKIKSQEKLMGEEYTSITVSV